MQTSGRQGFVIWGLRAEFPQSFDHPGRNQDPYVVFELGEEKVYTEVHKACGVFPDWVGHYQIPISAESPAEELVITLFNNERVGPDGLLGRATIPVASLSSGQETALAIVDSAGGPAGTLFFKSAQADLSQTGAQTGMGGTGMMGDQRGIGTGVGLPHTGMGTMATGAGAGAGMQQVQGAFAGTPTVCDRQVFTTVEDRPVLKEQKIYTMEHHPYEKQYAVETKFVGEQENPALAAPREMVGTEVRVIEQATPAPPCADAPAIGAQALQQGQQGQQQQMMPQQQQVL